MFPPQAYINCVYRIALLGLGFDDICIFFVESTQMSNRIQIYFAI